MPGKKLYLLLWGENTIESFNFIKIVFPQLKSLCSSRIEITLDADNIPADEYVKVELNSQYLLAYNEYYLSHPHSGPFNSQDSNTQGEEDAGDDDAVDEAEYIENHNTKPFESIFRINGESMEQEYQLTTLVVGKKKTVNLKQVVERKSQEIKDSDIMEFEPEGRISFI